MCLTSYNSLKWCNVGHTIWPSITCSAVAQQCVKAHMQSQWRKPKFDPPPVKSEHFKFSPKNLASVIMSWTSTSVPNVVAVSLAGASPHICEILCCCAFFGGCPILTVFFSDTRPRRTRGWIFKVDDSNGAFSPKDVPFGGQNNEI